MEKELKTIPYFNQPSIFVFYDGWCPFCRQSIKKFQSMDWFNRIEFKSFRNSNVVQEFHLDTDKLKKRMLTIKISNHKKEEGIDSINRICKNIPILWLLVPFLSISSKIGLGQKVYDWISRRRTIIPTGGCNENSCEIPYELDNK